MKRGKEKLHNQRLSPWTAYQMLHAKQSLPHLLDHQAPELPQSHQSLKKAKAEQAAAMARAAALEEKHSLQLEEIKLKSKMEQVDLEADLAASAAKIKILEMDEVEQEATGDGMNEYYDSS